MGVYRALLVANSTYPNDVHNLPDLEGPRNDAALLRTALCDDRYGMFPADNVRLVVERTMAEVLREAEDFLRGAERDDTLLVYYSGHGVLDISGDLFLAARDSRTDRLRSTMVSAADLSAMIDESAAQTQVVVVDCCHSGRFKGGDIARALAGSGRFVMTSCRTGELANDAHSLNRASMFTHHLVEAMRGGAPDLDGDGFVGIDSLYDYVHGRLAAESRQIPQKRFSGSGDVAMARRPTQGAAGHTSGSRGTDQAPERPAAGPTPPDDEPAHPRRRRLWVAAVAVAALAVAGTVIALVLGGGGGDQEPQLTVTPLSGAPGTVIDIAGDGCPPRPDGAGDGAVVAGLSPNGAESEIMVEDDDLPLEPGTSWHTRLQIPEDAPPGGYTVYAHCGASGVESRDDWTYYDYPSKGFEVTSR